MSKEELSFMKNKYFDYGGEGFVVRNFEDNTVYKIFYDDFGQPTKKKEEIEEIRLNKEKKIVSLYNLRDFDNKIKPLKTISSEGKMTGYEIPYIKDGLFYPFHFKKEVRIDYLKMIREKLSYYHCLGIVYGDIKANNIFIDSYGIITFGDLDNMQVGDYPMDMQLDCIQDYVKKIDKVDERLDAYMHNLMTLDSMKKYVHWYSEIVRDLKGGYYPQFVHANNDVMNVAKEMKKIEPSYSGRYFVDYM